MSSTSCRGWSTSSTSPSVTRPPSTPCSCATRPAPRASRSCSPGMGADELFGGYRKHLATLMTARYRRLPRPLRTGVVAPAVRAMPVAVGQHGLRTVRWAQRFLTFAELPGGGGVPPQLHPVRHRRARRAARPRAGRRRGRRHRPAPRGLRGHQPDRPGQPDVPGRHPDVHGGPQPHLHRPREHGRLDRGARAVRGPPRLRCGLLPAGIGQDPRTGAEGRPEGRRPRLAPRRDHRPAQGQLRGAAAGLGDQRPAASSSTTSCWAASSSARASCGPNRCGASSPTSAAVAGTSPSRSGSCSRSSSGTATHGPQGWARDDPTDGTNEGTGPMKQVAQNYRSGELVVLDVPAPACKPGGVLVRTLYSLISTGTELMKVTEARLSLLGKARARPDQVKKALDSMAQQGPVATYKKAINTLDSYTPLGYSLCGVVVEVGAGAEEFAVGDLVAAAGNEFALHAELNWVPTNLCVPVPEGVAPQHAAFATVGAIAMQGVRRGEAQLGETACVIGLGLVGQLVVRLLVAAGVRVVGVDTVPERCRLAETGRRARLRGPRRRGHGIRRAGRSARPPAGSGPTRSTWPPAATRTARWSSRRASHGTGRASSTSARRSSTCRGTPTTRRSSTSGSRGRTGRAATTTATSSRASTTRPATCAGPSAATSSASSTCSRPARSTSPRSSRASTPSPTRRRSTARCATARCAASDSCSSTRRRRRAPTAARRPRLPMPAPCPPAPPEQARAAAGPTVRLGFIGAGNYATSMLLPHLAKDPAATLATVATTRSLSAVNAQRKFGFHTATTDAATVLATRASTRSSSSRGTTRTRTSSAGRSSGQGGLRREAARPHPRRRRPGSRGRRADGQRPADGGLQPPFRAAVHRPAPPVRRSLGAR